VLAAHLFGRPLRSVYFNNRCFRRFAMMTRRVMPLAIALCPLLSFGCRSEEPTPAQPAATVGTAAATPAQGGTQSAQAGDLVCVTYCSPTEPGTPVAEIKWVVSSQPATAENLRKAAGAQNVEAAVNEDGFERGRFVRLSSVAPQARFAPAAPQPAGAAPLPGLGNLSVAAVASSQETGAALRLATPREASGENVVLQVQGLRPGLNYYWRVRAANPGQTQVVMCRAPICPTDRRR
jgi:hypothetical protein